MKTKIFLIALAFGAFACSNSSTQGDGSIKEVLVGGNKVSVLMLDQVKSGSITIPLSSLVDDFEMVQLEMNEDAIFGVANIITLSTLKEGTNNVLFIGKIKDDITDLW